MAPSLAPAIVRCAWDDRDYHPDGVYHLTAHGVDDNPIYRDDVDRQDFCIRFARVLSNEHWIVHAACLMDTHYHLLISPPRAASPTG